MKNYHKMQEWCRASIILLFLFIGAHITGCNDNDSAKSVPDPVTDGVLVPEHPRMGLTHERLTELKAKTGTPQWADLIGRMNNVISSGNEEYGFGAFHFAVAFAVTGEQKFADKSKKIIFRIIKEPGYCDVTSSFLRAPDCTGQVAMAADVLFDQLSDGEKTVIFDYLENNARNIVELNGWSGWGWMEGNPEYRQLNNYYPGHVQTILNYALLAYNHRELARQYYKRIVEEELPAAFALMREELEGGHGAEGTWYDDKLFGHYAEVVLMLREATSGVVDFGKVYADVFSAYVKFRLYAFTPVITENGKPQLYHLATGDQPAVAGAKVIDLARLRFWMIMDVLKNTDESETAGYIRHFEEHVDFESKGWQRELNLYYLRHFDNAVSSSDYTQALGNSYFSPGKGVAHYRTGWDSDAMTATIHFSPGHGQRGSHWHFGEGAFYIWYKGWQADHLNRIEGNGIRQNTALMNTLLINGDENSQGGGDASVLFFKGDENYMVVKGEATDNYNDRLEKFERTFIATGTMISIYDKVIKKNAEDDINFIVNNEGGFSISNTIYRAVNRGGQLTVKTVSPSGIPSVQPMGVRVDFASADTEIDLLHAIEAGDNGSSAATTLFIESVSADAGSFFGVQFLPEGHSYVHLVNKTDQAAASVGYTASFGAGNVEHVIAGLAPGNYTILKDGAMIGEGAVDDTGVIYFESTGGGAFIIRK